MTIFPEQVVQSDSRCLLSAATEPHRLPACLYDSQSSVQVNAHQIHSHVTVHIYLQWATCPYRVQ